MSKHIQQPETRPLLTASDANPLTRKLLHFASLFASDRQVLDELAFPDERYSADIDIITEGMGPRPVVALKKGHQ